MIHPFAFLLAAVELQIFSWPYIFFTSPGEGLDQARLMHIPSQHTCMYPPSWVFKGNPLTP